MYWYVKDIDFASFYVFCYCILEIFRQCGILLFFILSTYLLLIKYNVHCTQFIVRNVLVLYYNSLSKDSLNWNAQQFHQD
jgi:hypothetical protein